MRNRMMQWVVGLFVCAMVAAPSVWATSYAIDTDHSTVSFKIRHLVSYVQGSFNQFDGHFTYVPGVPEQWTVTTAIQAASIDTNVEKRDQHLRSKDFFDVAQYPTLEFVSTKATDVTPSSAKLHGLLTIHGVQKPVVLDLAIHGEGKDPWGNEKKKNKKKKKKKKNKNKKKTK